MKAKNEYIKLLRSFGDLLARQYGIRSVRIFGSVARNEHTPMSDVAFVRGRKRQIHLY